MRELIIFLVIVGFSALRGIMKAGKEKAEKERLQAQRGDPDRRQRVQGEIEAFLSEVGGGNQRPANAPAANADAQRVAERRERRRLQAETKRRQAVEQQRQQEVQQKRRQQQQRRQAEARTSTAPQRNVGSGVSAHVDQYINQHVSEHLDHDVDEYVEATIVDSVDNHLGDRATEMPQQTTVRGKQSSGAKDVIALLKDPAGVRNAILVNEILSRPRSLRR